MTAIAFWHDTCIKAFDGDEWANHIILFITGSQQSSPSVFQVVLPSLQDSTRDSSAQTLESLGFTLNPNSYSYEIPLTQWQEMTRVQREARRTWHEQQQLLLSRHLDQLLTTLPSLSYTHPQRLALIQEFSRDHRKNPGSVPFLSQITGFLAFQLQHPHTLAEWQVQEYLLTQNGQEASVHYIQFLCVLGLQLVYRDCIPPQHTTTQQEIKDMLRRLPPHQDTEPHYRESSIPRTLATDTPEMTP
ncbi:hypothetical protein BDF14DRAFT_1994163 [Spinellus fusiger]|nr:hypothetical protein BDF14DRAFT_1994163 [Spinellus fusiger]